MHDMGNLGTHTCLLTTARSIENADELLDVLRLTFKTVERLTPHEDATANWGEERASSAGPNILFQNSARWIAHKFKVPWLWMECDAVPLVPDWLDRIERAYNAQKRPFMGAYVDFKPAPPHMSGIAVYPANVALHAPSAMRCREGAWDLNGAKEILPKATFTKLIQHVWKVNGEVPTFPRDMALIDPNAVVFHRNKDLTLIDTLSGSTESRRASGDRGQSAVGIPNRTGHGTDSYLPVSGLATGSGSGAPPAQTLTTATEPEPPKTLSEMLRETVDTLDVLINGNPGQIANLHRLLRQKHLLRPAKKKKRK